MRSQANLIKDTHVITGTKISVTMTKEADIHSVLAKTDSISKHKGISTFIVQKGTAGFESGKLEDKMSYRGSPTSKLIFPDCVVPKD